MDLCTQKYAPSIGKMSLKIIGYCLLKFHMVFMHKIKIICPRIPYYNIDRIHEKHLLLNLIFLSNTTGIS